MPKKNGKTELAAALALYFLIGDGEPSPLVVCAASSEEQADLVFGAAKKMCELSPTLSQTTTRFDAQIIVPSIPGAVLKRTAAAAGANDGQNIFVVICDELHEWQGAATDTRGRKGRDCWTVLTNGTGARRQPLVLQITTAGFDRRTVCYEQYDHCKKIESGEIDDPRYHFYWVEAPEDADYKDPAVWEAANPSYGVTVHAASFEDQLGKKPENVFRRYFLNQWTSGEEAWLPHKAWDECAEPGREIPDGAEVYLAVDVAVKWDSSAIVLLHNDGEKVVVRAEIFESPRDGTKFDLGIIARRVRELGEQYQVEGVIYDSHRFETHANNLADEGFLMIEFKNVPGETVPATERLYEGIIDQRIAHNGDPKLAAHVEAGALKETEGGQRLSKGRAERAVDALICLEMGFGPAEEAVGGVPEATWF